MTSEPWTATRPGCPSACSCSGVIDPEERPALEAHLAGCERCSAELAEIAVLPGLLHRVDPAVAAAGLPAPPPRLQDRVVTAARVARTRRRRRVLGAVAAAAAVVVAALLVPGLVGGAEPGGRPIAVPSVVDRTDPQTSVHATGQPGARRQRDRADAGPRRGPPGDKCRLVARNAAGRTETAAWWVATYSGSARVVGNTSFPRSTITGLQVVRADGVVLVSLPLSHPRAG